MGRQSDEIVLYSWQRIPPIVNKTHMFSNQQQSILSLPRVEMSVYYNIPELGQINLYVPAFPTLHQTHHSLTAYQVYRKQLPSFYSKHFALTTLPQAAVGSLPCPYHSMIFGVEMVKDGGGGGWRVVPGMGRDGRWEGQRQREWFRMVGEQELTEMVFVALNNYGRLNEIREMDIQKGSILKLSSTFLRVVETHEHSSEQWPLENGDILEVEQIPYTESNQQNQQRQERPQCRICLQQDSPSTLLAPCRCCGTCKYIHFDCLKVWINQRVIHRPNGTVTAYHMHKLTCQLCKHPISSQVKIQGSLVNLIEWERLDEPYVVLESVGKSINWIVYVVRLLTGEVRIGRHDMNTLSLSAVNDQSISRVHCSLLFRGGKMVLRDSRSRYGTLVMIQKQINFRGLMVIQADGKQYQLTPLLPRKIREHKGWLSIPNPLSMPRTLRKQPCETDEGS